MLSRHHLTSLGTKTDRQGTMGRARQHSGIFMKYEMIDVFPGRSEDESVAELTARRAHLDRSRVELCHHTSQGLLPQSQLCRL